MDTEWTNRPDLNWCYNCWFNAKIESRPTRIGIWYLCRNCGATVHQHNDDKEFNKELPKYYTDEEWYEYWKKNIQMK